MPIWLMVQIDRWLGGLLIRMLTVMVPLRCTAPLEVRPGYGPNPRRDAHRHAPPRSWTPRVILVSKFFGMGSIILSVPLLRSLRARFPSSTIVFLSFSTHQKLLRFLPYVDAMWSIRPTVFGMLAGTVRVLWQCHRRSVDLFVDLESYSRYTVLLNFCSGATVRVGFHTVSLPARGRLLTHRAYWNPYRHVIDNYAALGGILGTPPATRTLELRSLKSGENQKGLVWLKRTGLQPYHYILFTPLSDSVRELNAYPEQGWLALADALHEQTKLPVVILGAKPDPRWTLSIRTRPHLHNLTGKTSLTALMVIVKHAAYLVSVDTGIAHLAAVFHVPALTLFGPDTPTLYEPINPAGQISYAGLHCSPCVNLLEGKRSDCYDNVCMNQWTPHQLCERVVEGLRAHSPSRRSV